MKNYSAHRPVQEFGKKKLSFYSVRYILINAHFMTVFNQTLAELQKAKPFLQEKYFLTKLAIFGSASRGEDTEQSDVNILVEFSAPVGMEFIHLAYELEALLHRKVDLVSRNGIKEKYFQAIKSDLVYV